jgi:hypothetical protein
MIFKYFHKNYYFGLKLQQFMQKNDHKICFQENRQFFKHNMIITLLHDGQSKQIWLTPPRLHFL